MDAIHIEMKQRAASLVGQKLQSIYLGGGTPSLLNQQELDRLFKDIYQYFDLADNPEITLEANPDDLHMDYLKDLSQSPVNRLSIGVQSFHQEDLEYMNRSHDVKQALESIETSLSLDFNLSIDLIYATPGMDNKKWEENLNTIIQFQIPHLSSYSLTVEPKTALEHMVKTGKALAPNQEQSAEQFKILMDFAKVNSYSHYEISNFATEGNEAVHNSNYWKGAAYLGLGPAAHSFNGKERSWNIANNSLYIKNINEGIAISETETLSPDEKYNEYLLISLRTKWGCDLNKIKGMGENYAHYFNEEIVKAIAQGWVQKEDEMFYLTEEGKFYADRISSDLFI